MSHTAKQLTNSWTNGAATIVSPEILSRTYPGIQANPFPLATGTGISVGQHGEILQGQLEDKSFHKRRFLLSLPCNLLHSRVTFRPSYESGLEVEPSHKQKVRRVVELTLGRFGLDSIGGRLIVETNIEEGKGYGSSTADCVAAALAATDAIGQSLTEEELARVVVDAEIASDNFMFKDAVLFAHREGVVIERFGMAMPKLEVLGFDAEVNGAVYTLDFPPAVYTWRQVQCFHTLVAGLRRGIREGDIALIARVATASAIINQEFLPKPMFSEIRAIARTTNALGIAVAHSGTVVCILLNPRDLLLEEKVVQIGKELRSIGINKIVRFQT
ncbi:MAG TPA: hypothetical protein VI685_16185 [Candidatus Angelobacter sp.]